VNRPPDPQPADRGLDEVELVVLAALAVAAVVVCLPALVVAVPLAMTIEGRGWRRWPALAAGAALIGLVVVVGGWDAYRHTVVSFWLHLRSHQPFRPVELVALAPLGVAGGIVAGPLLQVVMHHRNEHEVTRHYRDLSQARRTGTQARRTITRTTAWPEPDGRTVLGLPLAGGVPGWRISARGRPLVAPPLPIWRRQALILGETGTGKTVTALTLAAEALRGGWDVYWIDGKADPTTAIDFLALARVAGSTPATAPASRSTGGAATPRRSSTGCWPPRPSPSPTTKGSPAPSCAELSVTVRRPRSKSSSSTGPSPARAQAAKPW
jgi:hypothetical protein